MLTPYNLTSGSNKKVWWICSNDKNHEWEAQIYDRTGNKSNCPNCAVQLNSRGVRRIEAWLRTNGIFFKREKSFQDLKSPKDGNNCLRFDFFLEDFNVLIEFDGAQHFKSIKHWGGDKAFHERLENDNCKTSWAEKNNYKLIRISFKDEDQIEALLLSYLNDIFLV